MHNGASLLSTVSVSVSTDNVQLYEVKGTNSSVIKPLMYSKYNYLNIIVVV